MDTVAEPDTASQAAPRQWRHSVLPAPQDGVIDIRKYANRKLYIGRERYTSIPAIIRLIQAGRTVRVTCSISGADITASIISECMVAAVRSGAEVDVEALAQLVRDARPRGRRA